MENLTHSLTGLAVGALIDRSLPQEADPVHARQRQRLLLVAGWAASNFPDLDLLLSGLLSAPLGYLLHHRGHTHTLLMIVPQALLLAACLWLLWPGARRVLRASVQARAGLAIACGLGMLLHIAMDFLNSYGVHPFYPFDARWYYGDMVMVVEPFFWIVLGMPLAMLVRRLPLRCAWLALLAAAPLALAFMGYLVWPAALALIAAGSAAAALQWRHARRGLLAGFAMAAAGIAMQAAVSAHARAVVEAALQQRDPASRVLDVAMTAFPSHPLCWNFASVERNDSAGSYRLRRGTLKLAPATGCPAAMLEAGARLDAGALSYTWESHGSLAALRTLAASNCHVHAWMRFARVPEVDASATDIRFGPNGQPNFTTLRHEAMAGQACPGVVPPWQAPRADLLR